MGLGAACTLTALLASIEEAFDTLERLLDPDGGEVPSEDLSSEGFSLSDMVEILSRMDDISRSNGLK
jgi:hypothetical protein